ncbi:unnamed protein product [Anisakis simplex]|uniref:Cystatin n=1 Tax=Anisakis simplex TaxID=6269 RepID=A0A0M3KCU8_ANISI|nr:unnamed protein product [Anisakis simplex]
MPGGWTQQNVDSQDIKELSSRAMKSVNQQMNDIHYWIPIKILKAESHVVAGTEYRLEILAAQADCLKNQISAADFDAANCAEKEGGAKKIFTVNVWSKPWEDNFEKVTVTAQKAVE